MIRLSDSLVLTLIVASSGCAPAPDSASTPPGAKDVIPSERKAFGKPSAALARVSSHLLDARRRAIAGESPESIQRKVPLVQLTNGMALVEVRLERLDEDVLAALRASGFEDKSHSFEYAVAYGGIRLDDLEALASVDEVATIRPMPRARTR